jgi:hypothetical protein
MSAHRVSLYGTELWDQLTEEQRITLSIHEVCSVARVGLWFEIILMQMLLRYAYDRDPRTQHIQYALTEIADECRHSVMFAKMTERYGVPDYKGAGSPSTWAGSARPWSPDRPCSPARWSPRRSPTSCSARP